MAPRTGSQADMLHRGIKRPECGSICIFGMLIFMIAVGWREDRENRRERLSNPRRDQSITLAEWDPLADVLEDERLDP